MKYVFQTNCDTVLALSGSGHGGMETVINNLVGPGETLLVAKGGFWCERALEMAKRYGIFLFYFRFVIIAYSNKILCCLRQILINRTVVPNHVWYHV